MEPLKLVLSIILLPLVVLLLRGTDTRPEAAERPHSSRGEETTKYKETAKARPAHPVEVKEF